MNPVQACRRSSRRRIRGTWPSFLPHTTMSLLTLGPDVLLYVLRFADVYTVVQIRMVCRALHRLAQSKQLWIALVSSLKRRGLVALPPDVMLHQYSTPELVALVKRVVLGPLVWQSSPSSPTAPPTEEFIHRFVLPLTPTTTGVPLDAEHDLSRVEALPGGRHVLIQRFHRRQELWDVSGAKCIWAHKIVTATVALPVYEREEVVLCMFEQAAPESSLTVLVIDLATNAVEPALQLSIPAPLVAVRPHFVLSAYAPLVALEANFIQQQSVQRALVLINMEAGQFCLLRGNFFARTVQFLPGHVVVLADPDEDADSRTQIHLIFYALAKLPADLWRPLADLASLTTASLPADDMTQSPAPLHALTQTFFYATDRRLVEKQLELAVHASVLHSNAYLLSWYCGMDYMATAEDGTRDPEYTFARFHFRPARDDEPHVTPLTHITRRCTPHRFVRRGFAGSTGKSLTYAGFARRIHNPYSAGGFDGPLHSLAPFSDRTIHAVRLKKLVLEPYTPVIVAWWEGQSKLDVGYLA
ncbi:hypothetical protein MIND_00912300 [Mycena indigotica]|uniref:F-box domain-containing protein n=1 Tax=Mycena indigotica TaxID=2126181 RepID=A0A8H6SD90_9AGAR|nr:uncharacterized protein MIND_00912300 [Mycena indigotica]KAF7296813.1 hypothetical protein MIND_00912300 [Mycena indigotica]